MGSSISSLYKQHQIGELRSNQQEGTSPDMSKMSHSVSETCQKFKKIQKKIGHFFTYPTCVHVRGKNVLVLPRSKILLENLLKNTIWYALHAVNFCKVFLSI
ncbi:unnamed protein product [Ilex paraguariensis]|uniref:Uncharacterized protein n=1 Tax=Ilex paraguariensis TaxID=185542 RepID=A0ABC8SFT9_9AQUA